MIILHQLTKTQFIGKTLLMMKKVVFDMASFFAFVGIIFFLFLMVSYMLSRDLRLEQYTSLQEAIQDIFDSLNAKMNY